MTGNTPVKVYDKLSYDVIEPADLPPSPLIPPDLDSAFSDPDAGPFHRVLAKLKSPRKYSRKYRDFLNEATQSSVCSGRGSYFAGDEPISPGRGWVKLPKKRLVSEMSPLIKNRTGEFVSSNMTMMAFLRSQIAAGSLSLGVSFQQGGLWLSFALSPLIGLINIVFGLSLVHCSHYLCKKSGKPSLDYGHLCKRACDHSNSQFLQSHSKKALYICNIFIAIYQLGVAAMQYSFVVWNIRNCIMFVEAPWIPSYRLMGTLLLPAFILVAQFTNLTMLSYLSSIGNVVFTVGSLFIAYNIVQPPNEVNALPAATNLQGAVVFAGSMIYSYEGQSMILPLENKMKHPEDMASWSGVLTTCTVIMGCVYTFFGFFAYAKFGNKVGTSITLNMPYTALFQTVNLFLAAAVFLGYSLQLFVILEMLWQPITRKVLYRWPEQFPWFQRAFRLTLVMITFIIIVVVPDMNLLMSITGMTAGVMISMIFPPLLDMVVMWDARTMKEKVLYGIRDGSVLVAGLFFLTYGTASAVIGIVNQIDVKR